MAKRMGLIESIDEDKKIVNLIGYGEFIGSFPKDFEGIDVDTSKVLLDSGKEVWVDEGSFFAEQPFIEQMIATHKGNGYEIICDNK